MRKSSDKLGSTLFLATRELARQPARALLGVLVAGFVVGLVMTFQGFRVGIYQDLARFPSSLPADRVVLEKGVRNLSLARSVLPQSARAELEALDAVAAAHPIASVPVILDARDRKTPVQLIVYDSAGGPRQLVRGAGPETADGNGLVMDERLADFLDYRIGDTVTLFDYGYRLTGTARETASPFAPYIYLTYDGMLDMYFSQGSSISPDAMIFLSALLVEFREGATQLPADIHERYAVWTPEELGAFDRRMGERMLGPALNLLVLIGFVIAVLTMGLLMYSKALGRQREYGVQKALGVPAGWMIGQLAVEGVLLVLLAMPVAILLSLAIGELMLAMSPLYRVEILDAGVLLRSWAASTLACLAGSLMPMHRVATADPAVVFRGADV
jgi:putative ABC transport system permease protein